MYNRQERKSIEFSMELAYYELHTTLSGFVTDERSLKLFKESTNAHKIFTEKRVELYSANVEIVKKEIEYVETVGKKYEQDNLQKLSDFYKAISKLPDDVKSQMKISEPQFPKFGGLEDCGQLLIILNAELLEFETELRKYEIRLKILNHNIKTVSETYG